MQVSKLIPAALAALTITGFAASANAASSADDGGYFTRAVRSNNGKDYFVRLVQVPKTRAVAENRNCPKMKAPAAMAEMCDGMMDDHHGAAPAPKG
jgi:hypothetical protein